MERELDKNANSCFTPFPTFTPRADEGVKPTCTAGKSPLHRGRKNLLPMHRLVQQNIFKKRNTSLFCLYLPFYNSHFNAFVHSAMHKSKTWIPLLLPHLSFFLPLSGFLKTRCFSKNNKTNPPPQKKDCLTLSSEVFTEKRQLIVHPRPPAAFQSSVGADSRWVLAAERAFVLQLCSTSEAKFLCIGAS